MYLSPINYQTQVISNKKRNNISMKANKVPYCLDTRVHDTVLKRLNSIDMKSLENVNVFIKKNFATLWSNKEAISKEHEMPLYKINSLDFIDTEKKAELLHEGAYYINKVIQQLRDKFMNTGERSVLLFEDIDKILSGHPFDVQEKRFQIINLIDKAESNGIIPVFSAKDSASIDPVILNRLTPIKQG